MAYEKVLKGASLLTAAALAGSVLSLARVMVLARFLGVAGYGTFLLVTSLAALAASLVLPSFESAIQTYYARFAAESRKKADQFVTAATLLMGGCAVAAAALLMLTGKPIAEGFFQAPQLSPFVGVAALYVVLNPVNDCLETFLLAMERFKAYAALSILLPLAYLVSTLVALWHGWGLSGALWALVGSQALLLGVNAFLLRKHVALEGARIPGKVFRFWLPIGGIDALKAFQGNLPALLIGKMLGLEAVGFYGIARKTADITATLVSPYAGTLNVVALNAFHQSQKAFDHLVNTGVKHISLLSIYVGSVLLLAARPLLAFFYGNSFLPAVQLFQWTAYSVAFMTPNFLYKTVLMARDAPRGFFVGSVAGIAANFALLIGLMAGFGLAGLAYTQMAYAAVTLAIILFFMARVRQPFEAGNLLKPVGLSLAGLWLVGVNSSTVWEAAPKAIAFSGLYWAAVFGLGLLNMVEVKALARKGWRKMRWRARGPGNGSGLLA